MPASRFPVPVQAKPKVGAVNDPQEEAADRIADHSMRMAVPDLSAPGQLPVNPGHSARAAGGGPDGQHAGPRMTGGDAQAMTHEELRSSGRPLDAGTRGYFEPRLRLDLGRVRVHTDAEAGQSARALNARAYTLGHDIVFGTGSFAPGTERGKRLLAHELAHVAQQHGQDPVIRRDKRPKVHPRSFSEVFWDFTMATNQGEYLAGEDTATAKALARELSSISMTDQEVIDHAIGIALWAHEHALPAVRDNMLGRADKAWRARFGKGTVPAAGGVQSFLDGPEALAHDAEAAARTGDHAAAFSLFGLAHLFYSLEILQLTQERGAAERAGKKWPAGATSYPDAQHVYDGLRNIYGFYYQLEREARRAGDAKRAAAMAAMATRLRAELKRAWSFQGESIIAEATGVDTQQGPGLMLHGANNAEIELTALPGLPVPKEVKTLVQWQELGQLQEALGLQTDFLAEVARAPEVQKEFRGQAIDMNDVAQRLRLWKVTYLAVKRSGGRALAQLMELIGRYLKAFTKHTEFNVRDWGPSYLDTKMPTDLAGRAERDCGVYALTVAWETFKTLKDADPGASVDFRLVALLDHVVLIIDDRKARESYMVNNDEITGPDKGDPLAQVGRAWAKVRGLALTAGPATEVPLGSTASAEPAFRTDLWKEYTAKANLQLRNVLPMAAIKELETLKKTDPQAFAKRIAEITEATYTKFYADLQQLDKLLRALDARLDQIVHARVPDNDLKKAMPTLGPAAVGLTNLFASLLPETGLPVEAKGRVFGVFSRTSKNHPLVRAAMAMLRLEQKLGGSLADDEKKLITFCDLIPLFHTALDEFRSQGMPPVF